MSNTEREYLGARVVMPAKCRICRNAVDSFDLVGHPDLECGLLAQCRQCGSLLEPVHIDDYDKEPDDRRPDDD